MPEFDTFSMNGGDDLSPAEMHRAQIWAETREKIAWINKVTPHTTPSDVKKLLMETQAGNFIERVAEAATGQPVRPTSLYLDLEQPGADEANGLVDQAVVRISDHPTLERGVSHVEITIDTHAKIIARALRQHQQPSGDSSLRDCGNIRDMIDPGKDAYGISYWLVGDDPQDA